MITNLPPRAVRLRAALLVAGALLFPIGSLQAQPAKPNPAAAQTARKASETAKKQVEFYTTKHAQSAPELKKGSDSLVAAYQTAAAAQLKLAEAYEVGAASDIAAAVGEVTKANAAVSRGLELVGALENSALHALTKPVDGWTKSTLAPAHAQLEAYLTARRTASAAAAKLAATFAPDANPEALDAARDEWFAALNEVILAEKIWTSARDQARDAAIAEKTKNTDLATKLEELKKTDAEVVSLSKQRDELLLKLRKLQRQRLQTANAVLELKKPKKK